ncbi:MAG: hypothetical protein V9F00_03030 [Nocardioides sp.]
MPLPARAAAVASVRRLPVVPAVVVVRVVVAPLRVRSVRPGGPSRRGRKSKRQRRQEFDNMEAPTIGGMRVRKGNGEIVRLARGASLTDFAEKIGVDAAPVGADALPPRRDGHRDPVRGR